MYKLFIEPLIKCIKSEKKLSIYSPGDCKEENVE